MTRGDSTRQHVRESVAIAIEDVVRLALRKHARVAFQSFKTLRGFTMAKKAKKAKRRRRQKKAKKSKK